MEPHVVQADAIVVVLNAQDMKYQKNNHFLNLECIEKTLSMTSLKKK